MDERVYEQIKKDLAAEYRKKLEALDIIWASYRDKAKNPTLELDVRASITDLVRQVLPKLGEEFSIWDIKKAIEKTFPEAKGTFRKNSLSGTLTRMQQRGEIEIVRKGSGTLPTTYRLHIAAQEVSSRGKT
jgi:hypothetical protein